VDRWVRQFSEDAQLPLLVELDNVLASTYFSREVIRGFADRWIVKAELAGIFPRLFWSSVNFLRIQQNGHSQDELLPLFDDALRARWGLALHECGSEDGPHLYLDDVLFTGNRVTTDLGTWIAEQAPPEADVHVLVVAAHKYGLYDTRRRLDEHVAASGKNVRLNFWFDAEFENRKAYRAQSEVLWPSELPDDPAVTAYVASEQRFPFVSRPAGGTPYLEIFSSEEGRQLLEREFLLAGLTIRSRCQQVNRSMRPLGLSSFGLGFGSLVATFRNCPNNCPLALWWGEGGPSRALSWYPLLPRKTYSANGGDYGR
jgi:hypothetical protein